MLVVTNLPLEYRMKSDDVAASADFFQNQQQKIVLYRRVHIRADRLQVRSIPCLFFSKGKTRVRGPYLVIRQRWVQSCCARQEVSPIGCITERSPFRYFRVEKEAFWSLVMLDNERICLTSNILSIRFILFENLRHVEMN